MKKTIDEYVEFFVLMSEETNKKFENNEFLEKLYSALSKKIDLGSNTQTPQTNSFYEEIKRTRYFLKHIDRESWLEGLSYYSRIKIPVLKIELTKDFKEMKIADRENDIIEYSRRLIMQLENSINTVIEIIDAWVEIANNPTYYQDDFNNLNSGRFGFFDSGEKRELKDISLPSKLFFIQKYYSFKYYRKPINEMMKIRNKASHRGEVSPQEQKIMEDAKNNVTQKKSEYFNAFDSIMQNLNDLYL